MPDKIEQAPICCRHAMERIYDILDAGSCLEEILAAAPALVKPQPRISLIGFIWQLGSGAWSFRKNRKTTSKILEPIIQNRVIQIIDFELLNHNNQPELSKHWTQIRKEFQSRP